MLKINTSYEDDGIKGQAMTVGELIKELQKYDNDFFVGIDLASEMDNYIHTYNISYVEMGVHMEEKDFKGAKNFKSVSIVYNNTFPPLVSE